jgi:hypothetical protein
MRIVEVEKIKGSVGRYKNFDGSFLPLKVSMADRDFGLAYGLRPKEASVVRGMVLGDRSLILQDLEAAFRRSGARDVSITGLLQVSFKRNCRHH